MTWKVIIDGQESETPSTRYSPPYIESLSGPGAVNASTNGGELITLHGKDFGSSAQGFLESVTYGITGIEYRANGCNITQDHFEITCRTVRGVGYKLKWTVRVSGQRSSSDLSAESSYEAPVIEDFICVTGANCYNTQGGAQIDILGKNFGIFENPDGGFTTEALIDFSGNPRRLVQAGRKDGKDFVRFTVPQGQGTGRFVRLNVGGQPSNSFLFDYGPPVIDSLYAEDSELGILLFIYGNNFGLNGDVFINGHQVYPSIYGHRFINCTVEDRQGNVTVRVGSRMSNSVEYKRISPVIRSIFPSRASTEGGVQLQIRGTSLQGTYNVTVGGRVCRNIQGVDDKLVRCILPPGQGNFCFIFFLLF